jgi:hypothetical protein
VGFLTLAIVVGLTPGAGLEDFATGPAGGTPRPRASGSGSLQFGSTVTTLGSGGSAGLGTRGGFGPAGASAFSGHVPPCLAGTICVDVNAARAEGPVGLVAEGFLHGVDGSTDPNLVAPLHPRSWQIGNTEAAYGMAQAQGAVITDILSDAWYQATYTPARGTGEPPWSDWSAYSRWVQLYVRSTLADHHVDYWDIQNEPDAPIGGAQPTVDQVLEEFSVAAQAIRSVDPSARIMGPSTDLVP